MVNGALSVPSADKAGGSRVQCRGRDPRNVLPEIMDGSIPIVRDDRAALHVDKRQARVGPQRRYALLHV
jgi:hypothetical protein